MKKLVLSLLLLVLAPLAMATAVGPLNYQGRLLDNQGIPVTGTYDFTVRIYNALSGGTLKYEEPHSGVIVEDGVYSFKVGTGPKTGGDSLWDISLWQLNLNNLFMEVEVNGETLTPRHELTSAPHAYTATLALAIGNRTAEDFDNILEGICVGNKGKWLSLAQKCAGNGADLSGVHYATLDPSYEYENLELNGVNFSNAIFGGVYFDNSMMKDANITNTNFSGARFYKATLDGATFSSPPNFTNANLMYAKFKNMSLAGVDLSTAQLNYFSADHISGCPTLPAGWACVTNANHVGPFNNSIVGVGSDYSVDSTRVASRFGKTNYFELPSFGGITNLTGSIFSNIYARDLFWQNLTLDNTNFQYAELVGMTFDFSTLTTANLNKSILNWATYSHVDLTNTLFTGTLISNSTFEYDGVSNADFSNAKINTTRFRYINNGSVTQNGNDPAMNFLGARLSDVKFDRSHLGGSNFANTVLSHVTFTQIPQSAGTVNFSSAHFDDVDFSSTYSVFNGVKGNFWGAGLFNTNFSYADLSDSNFTSAQLNQVNFANTKLHNVNFTNAVLTDPKIDNADFTGSDWTGITFQGSAGLMWYGVRCPDGVQIWSGTCFDGHL